MSVLLTIGVPTFNRVERLKNCLNNIITEITGKPVELLVSDNASTDGTQAFMEEYCKLHPEVTYVRNSENVGPDRNFLNCYNRASGEYVFLQGDDDLLLPGAVDAILEVLARKPVFLRLNTSGQLSLDPLVITDPIVPEEGIKVYRDSSEFIRDMGIYITFMSAFILRTDLVRNIENKEQFIGTYFIQSHIALHTLATKGEYVFLTKNCVAANVNETLNYDLYMVWGTMYYKLLMETGVKVGLDAAVLNEIHKKDLEGTIFDFVKDFRASCHQSGNWDKEAILDAVKPYPALYVRYWAAVCLPLPVVKAIRRSKQGVKKLLGR